METSHEQIPHKLDFPRARVLLPLCAILALAGFTFALTPLQPVADARQVLAARWKANPAAEKVSIF